MLNIPLIMSVISGVIVAFILWRIDVNIEIESK